MKIVSGLGLIAAASATLGGCAHLPNATIGYYLPTSEVRFKVVRTIACDPANNIIGATAVTPTVSYLADTTARRTVDFSKLKGALSDSELKFEFTDDGRLSGFNATQTGQGEAVLKTVISIATSVAKGPGLSLVDFPGVCAVIKKLGGGKPLTLTYSGMVDVTKSAAELQPLTADPDSARYAELLSTAIGGVSASVKSKKVAVAPVTAPVTDGIGLTAKQPGMVEIEIYAGADSKVVWNERLLVASIGTEYVLPLPRAAMFGTKTMAVSFADSGALKSVQYVSKTGAGQAANVLASGVDALKGQTTAEKVADVKAQADLIAAQQRLVGCLADAITCK